MGSVFLNNAICTLWKLAHSCICVIGCRERNMRSSVSLSQDQRKNSTSTLGSTDGIVPSGYVSLGVALHGLVSVVSGCRVAALLTFASARYIPHRSSAAGLGHIAEDDGLSRSWCLHILMFTCFDMRSLGCEMVCDAWQATSVHVAQYP